MLCVAITMVYRDLISCIRSSIAAVAIGSIAEATKPTRRNSGPIAHSGQGPHAPNVLIRCHNAATVHDQNAARIAEVAHVTAVVGAAVVGAAHSRPQRITKGLPYPQGRLATPGSNRLSSLSMTSSRKPAIRDFLASRQCWADVAGDSLTRRGGAVSTPDRLAFLSRRSVLSLIVSQQT